MSHTHDLGNIEMRVRWSEDEDCRIDASEVLGGKWVLNLTISTICGVEIPIRDIAEQLHRAMASPNSSAKHEPQETPWGKDQCEILPCESFGCYNAAEDRMIQIAPATNVRLCQSCATRMGSTSPCT